MFRRMLLICICVLLVTACLPPPTVTNTPGTPGTPNDPATQTAAAGPTATVSVSTPTSTVAPQPVPGTATPTATPAPQGRAQFLAYISPGHLLITDVTNGVRGGTTQYTLAGISDQVTDLVWSPSGEFVAFVSAAKGAPHIFYIFALGQSTPIDLGPGSTPAWSPDSRSIAYVSGAYPNDNIWMINIDNRSPRQLTFESNYAWGRPAFTSDGNSLVVAGASRNDMGAQGNTTFTLQSLALDGSGGRATLPGATPLSGVRLPQDLRFSPNGSRLGFSTSSHLSACASPGAYYVSDAIGGNRQELLSPSMRAAVDPNQDRYHTGLSYAWLPTSDGLVVLGNVMDCNFNSPTMGKVIAGPQMSIIGLDGTERTIIPGFFYGISVDRSGKMIAGAHFEDGFQDLSPTIEIYSADNGQLLLSLGQGSNPQFQP